jgi:hypothetical protein
MAFGVAALRIPDTGLVACFVCPLSTVLKVLPCASHKFRVSRREVTFGCPRHSQVAVNR